MTPTADRGDQRGDEDKEHRRDEPRRHQRQDHQHDRHAHRRDDDGSAAPTSRTSAHRSCCRRSAEAEGEERHRHEPLGLPGNLGDERRDVRIPSCEHAAEPIDPAMNVSATRIDPKARNSCITEFASACTIRGTKTAIIASAPAPPRRRTTGAAPPDRLAPSRVTRGTLATFGDRNAEHHWPTARPIHPVPGRWLPASPPRSRYRAAGPRAIRAIQRAAQPGQGRTGRCRR